MPSLSILIPARNEEWLAETLNDLIKNIRGETEIIVVLDGEVFDKPLPTHERITYIRHETARGQRAATNDAARIARGTYLMKTDAHTAWDEGFDVKMVQGMKDLGDDTTLLPVMRNLHVFDWVCPDGHRRYQGISGPCTECGKETHKELVWNPKPAPQSTAYMFDTTLHFQYDNGYKRRAEYKRGELVKFGISFDLSSIPISVILLLADLARSHHFLISPDDAPLWEKVASYAMSLPSVDHSRTLRTSEILSITDQFEVGGIDTLPISTAMVNHGDVPTSSLRDGADEPSIRKTMCHGLLVKVGASSISTSVGSPCPIPTSGCSINSNIIDKFNDLLDGRFLYSEKTNTFHNGSVTLTPKYDKSYTQTMSIQGSCFMVHRDKYFELDLSEEAFGSWGQQGVEVACKTWLSGGKVMVNHNTWYAHLFRTAGGDFGFPYKQDNKQVEHAREYSRHLFQRNNWPKAVRSFEWLLERFKPLPYWDVTKEIIYYTDCKAPETVASAVRNQLTKSGLPIVSVSLNEPVDLGKNIVHKGERGYLTMFKQILKGLENSKADVVFLCEHDVLYPPEYFTYTPPSKEKIYYNKNVWHYRTSDGFAVYYDAKRVSQICAYRDTLIEHYRKRVEMVEKNGFTRRMGFEPGTHRRPERVDNLTSEYWWSDIPAVDIKHGKNLTEARWNPSQFRDQKNCQNWKEQYGVPEWDGLDVLK